MKIETHNETITITEEEAVRMLERLKYLRVNPMYCGVVRIPIYTDTVNIHPSAGPAKNTEYRHLEIYAQDIGVTYAQIAKKLSGRSGTE